MKFKQILVLLFFLISFVSYSQFKVSMTFNDGKEVMDNVRPSYRLLVSTTTKKKYHFDDVSEVKVIKKDSVIEYYYPLVIKYGNKSSKISKGLGMKVYDSEYLEIFHAYFSYFNLNNRLKYITKYNPKYDTFIRRKGEPYSYSVGCIDGVGCEGIFGRISQFFEDCPEVIEQIKKRIINNRDIMTIAGYYNEHCGTN